MPVPKCFIPQTGGKFKLRLLEQYAALNVHAWTWFKRTDRRKTPQAIKAQALIYRDSLPTFEIDVKQIDPPIYWEPTYTIRVKSKEKAKAVWGWLHNRGGIRCGGSLDLSNAGTRFYSPGDTGKHHWSASNGEIVTDPDRIAIVVVETIMLPPNDAGGWRREVMRIKKRGFAGFRIGWEVQTGSHGHTAFQGTHAECVQFIKDNDHDRLLKEARRARRQAIRKARKEGHTVNFCRQTGDAWYEVDHRWIPPEG